MNLTNNFINFNTNRLIARDFDFGHFHTRNIVNIILGKSRVLGASRPSKSPPGENMIKVLTGAFEKIPKIEIEIRRGALFV